MNRQTQPPSRQQTLQQERAASAWNNIESVRTAQKDYGSLVRSLPAMIQSDGLAPALAFLKAKAKNNEHSYHMVLFHHISDWVMARMVAQGDLLEALMHCDTADYRRAAVETLAYVSWLKRFAEAQGWGDATGDNP